MDLALHAHVQLHEFQRLDLSDRIFEVDAFNYLPRFGVLDPRAHPT
ncbi:hypothetical protein [Jannaschia seosinensis]|nr:hypothetical protein [Jannaschia seosinensis]